MAQHELQVHNLEAPSVKAVNWWSCKPESLTPSCAKIFWASWPQLDSKPLKKWDGSRRMEASSHWLFSIYFLIMVNSNSTDKLWVCIHCFPLPFHVVPTSGFQQTGCWIKTGLQEINLPIRKVWSPYLLCLFACKETWTNMPSCHPPTVLPRAQHAGGSNPPKWKN